MGDTIWIKHLKEGLTLLPNPTTPNPTPPGDTGDGADGDGVTGSGVGVTGSGVGVAGADGDGDPVDGGGYGSYFSKISNFGENPYIGEDSNELIFKGKKPPIPKTTTAPSETTPPIETKPPVTNANKANAAYSNYSNNTKNIISKLVNIPVYIATKMVKALYDNMDSSNVQNDVDIIADQISLWIKYLVVSYIFVINWWYIRCYTDYEFNFKDILTFDIIYWSSVGPASAIQVLNYPLLGFRYNKDMLDSVDETAEPDNTMSRIIQPIPSLTTATSTTKEAKNNKFSDKQMMKYIKSVHDVLWGWRPIAFSLFHLIIFLIMMSFSVSAAIESNMTDNSTFFMIICILSIYYFITLFIKEQWYLKFMNGIVGYLLLVALLIGALIVMYLFNRIVCPIFTVYFLVLSYFAILIFQGLGVIKKLTEFYTDLEPEPITEQGKKPDSSEKIFQYFHRIYFILMVIAIVIYNCYNSTLISFEPLLILTIVLNVLMFFLFGFILGNRIIYNTKDTDKTVTGNFDEKYGKEFIDSRKVGYDTHVSYKNYTTPYDNQTQNDENNLITKKDSWWTTKKRNI